MLRTGRILKRLMSPSSLASMGLAALLWGASPASAQTLGATQSFGVLGGSSVTAGGAGATINGDVGVSPGTSITGPVTVVSPFGIHNNDLSAIAARAAYLTLNASLLSGGCTALASDQLNGQTLGPGCHSGGALDLAATGSLNLTGAGIYIFRAASSLTTGVGSNVVLNGVDPCNVYWQITSLATLDGITFPGTVVAGTGVHLGVGANLTGRALAAAAGDVTMAGGNIVGGCSGVVTGTPTLGRPAAAPSVPLGASITDIKTLAGGANVPQGTITFNLYGPNDATCSGAVIFTSTVSVDGNGSYSSTSFTPSAIGTYRWIANYSGDANNAPTANTCNAPNENVNALAAPGGGGASIPTLSGWGLMSLMVLIGIASIYRLRRI